MLDEFDDPRGGDAIKSIFRSLKIGGRVRPRRPLLAAIPVLGLMGVLGSVLWYSYPKETADQELRAVPIIRADASAYKVMPNEPGGMEIAHRDSTVFDTLRETRMKGDSRPVENLLAEPEKPMTQEELMAALGVDEAGIVAPLLAAAQETEPPVATAVAGQPDETGASQIVASQETTLPEVSEKSPIQDLAMAVPLPVAKPMLSPAEEKKVINEVTATEPAAGTPAGNHYVQLGSLRSREAAEKSWAGFQDKFPQLEDLMLRIQEADLGAQGMYYRVQGGPVEEAEARAICRSVEEKQPGGCLVVSH